MNRDELALLLKEHNQEHLLSYYDKLSQKGKESLAAQIEGVNWGLINFEPDNANSYKFEELVLDMVHLFDNCLPFEVIRENEFAPVKNAAGDDSIDTARQLLIKHGYVL